MLKARRLTAQQAARVITDFYTAWGPEQMRASYGWGSVEGAVSFDGKSEKFFAFANEDKEIVGWGSCFINTRDPNDDIAALAIGVFPNYQRRGYRKEISEYLCQWAKEKGAERASIIVKHANSAHYQRHLRESRKGPWVHAGEVWFPVGYGIFVRPLDEPASSTPPPRPEVAARPRPDEQSG